MVVDHFGLKSGFKGHGHGRALWMAMMLIADHITKTVFKSKLKKSKVITPTGDGPAFYRHMGYTLHKGDGNNDLTLEIATHTAIGGGAGERSFGAANGPDFNGPDFNGPDQLKSVLLSLR